MHLAVMKADVMQRFGGLKRCQLQSGRIHWLCEEHIKSTSNISVLESSSVSVTQDADQIDVSLLTEEFAKLNGKHNAKKQFKAAALVMGKTNLPENQESPPVDQVKSPTVESDGPFGESDTSPLGDDKIPLIVDETNRKSKMCTLM